MRKIGIALLLAIALAASAFAQSSLISPKAAKELLASGKDVLLLDVRTQEEFLEGHIAGSILLPYDQITAKSAAQIIGSKDRTVIVYCRTGRRSAAAAASLVALGYKKVLDLGGIQAWPYGTIKGILK